MKHPVTILLILAACLLGSCSRPTPEAEAEAYACRLPGERRWTLVTREGDLLPLPGDGHTEPGTVVGGMYALRGADSLMHLYTTDPHRTTGISPRGFHRIGYFFDRVAIAQSTPLTPFELIDRQGNTRATLPDDIILMHGFSCGRALVYTRSGKYGYIDSDGHMAVAPRWDYASDFREGLALVGQADSAGRMAYCFIDCNGTRRTDVDTHGALLGEGFSCGLLDCRQADTGTSFYLTADGKTAFVLPDSILAAFPFREGLAVVRTRRGAGLIDTQGQIVVTPEWDDIRVVHADRVLLCKKGIWHAASPDGKPESGTTFDSLLAVAPGPILFVRPSGEKGIRLVDARTMESGSIALDTVSLPAAALRLEPEVFVRNMKKRQAVPTDTAQKTKPQPAPETRTEAEDDLPRRVTYRESDWTQVARDNPFYAEAVKVVSGRLEETDAARRRTILNYMEHLRTAYTTKDIDFLRQLFSERALIIVGTVIETSSREETGYLPHRQVVYNVKSKQAYLSRLAELFRKNKHIDVEFSGFQIMRHPTVEGLYGVNVRQHYDSDIYSDDGYLFLLWDFRDPTAPQIHVRTWQPAFPEGQPPLEEDEVLNISSFNLQ